MPRPKMRPEYLRKYRVAQAKVIAASKALDATLAEFNQLLLLPDHERYQIRKP